MQVQKAALSKREVAAELGIGYMTVHRLTKEGTIRTVRAGARVLIPRTELDRFLAGDTRTTAQ